MLRPTRSALLLLLVSFLLPHWPDPVRADEPTDEPQGRRLLYVAVPGIRDYLEYGGHGLLVFDIDDGHRLLKRIPTAGLTPEGVPINVKGICANAETGLLHISTITTLQCLDLKTEELLWEIPYEGGCDRMALSPDGKTMYLPSFEAAHWNVVDATSGDIIATVVPDSGAHNTVYGLDGRFAYLAGLRSNELTVADTSTHTIAKTVGPFSHSIRPFSVDGSQTRCYVNVNELLGFEIGDITTGAMLTRVEVAGFNRGPVKRHGCPSHGIGLTPDESEVWVVDAFNQHVHVFDNTTMPPTQRESIAVRDEPGWITFSLDGSLAWPSTGDVIDTATKEIITSLADEDGNPVMSEKVVEIHWQGGEITFTGDQFGLGRVVGD